MTLTYRGIVYQTREATVEVFEVESGLYRGVPCLIKNCRMAQSEPESDVLTYRGVSYLH